MEGIAFVVGVVIDDAGVPEEWVVGAAIVAAVPPAESTVS